MLETLSLVHLSSKNILIIDTKFLSLCGQAYSPWCYVSSDHVSLTSVTACVLYFRSQLAAPLPGLRPPHPTPWSSIFPVMLRVLWPRQSDFCNSEILLALTLKSILINSTKFHDGDSWSFSTLLFNLFDKLKYTKYQIFRGIYFESLYYLHYLGWVKTF